MMIDDILDFDGFGAILDDDWSMIAFDPLWYPFWSDPNRCGLESS